MEFAISMGVAAWILLLVVAVAFGAIAQFIGDARTGYEWLIDAIAFGIGAIVASEFIVGARTFEPVWDGLALVPALIGGLALGGVVAIATRFLTGGTHTRHPMPS